MSQTSRNIYALPRHNQDAGIQYSYYRGIGPECSINRNGHPIKVIVRTVQIDIVHTRYGKTGL